MRSFYCVVLRLRFLFELQANLFGCQIFQAAPDFIHDQIDESTEPVSEIHAKSWQTYQGVGRPSMNRHTRRTIGVVSSVAKSSMIAP
jgi:hypothetical protein